MRKWKNKGFTLLEVMLAVAILSIGLVLVVRSYVTSLQAIKDAQNFLIANLLLEEKIWEKQEEQLQTGKVSTEENKGEFASALEKFSYKINFEPQKDFPPEYQGVLYKTSFTISWQEKQKEHQSSCVTFLRSKEE